MPCEKYREALTEAAAAGEYELSIALRAHLDACSVCRAFFAEEQQLFARIESGIHSVANSEMPASLLAGVRVRLGDRKAEEFSWIRASALLTGAVVLLVVGMSWSKMRRENGIQAPRANTMARNSGISVNPVTRAPVVGNVDNKIAHARAASRKQSGVRDSRPYREVPVFVPAGQKKAVDAWLAAVRSGAIKPEMLLDTKKELAERGRDIVPLDIPAIEIKPLATVSPETATADTSTRF